jgi:hypothetical protein
VRYRASGQPGLAVLGVTPGSSADALGLHSGDRLLAVNGVPLDHAGFDASGRSLAAQQLRDALLGSPDAIALDVARGDREVRLEGSVRVVDLPAYRLDLGTALANVGLAASTEVDGNSSCARISVFDIAPRSQHLYRAVLVAVDGTQPGPTGSDVFRIAPGRHRLTVNEAIDSRQFDSVALRQRDGRQRLRSKELEFVAQPGITYRLAVRLNTDQRNSIRDGAYWEPVIWKETPESCR